MPRAFLLVLILALPVHVHASAPQDTVTGTAPIETPEQSTPATPGPAAALPPIRFLSTIAREELLAIFQSEPMLAGLDPEVPGSPLTLVVTHTLRPTAGGQAAGLVSAILSGGTLGLIPVVSNERLVVRYEVMLNGKSIASRDFERTATRAQNLWSAGNDGYGGLGKAGMEWMKSTATEAAASLAADPGLRAVQEEIDFYFPTAVATPEKPGDAP